jgi:hypothetical protein
MCIVRTLQNIRFHIEIYVVMHIILLILLPKTGSERGPSDIHVTQQQKNYWEMCSLCSTCLGFISRTSLEFSYLWDSYRRVRAWTRKLRDLQRWKPLPGNSRWRHRRLRRHCTWCSEVLNVWISDSAIFTLVTICKCSINPNTNPNQVYTSRQQLGSMNKCILCICEHNGTLFIIYKPHMDPHMQLLLWNVLHSRYKRESVNRSQMDITFCLCISLRCSTVQLHDSLGSRRACVSKGWI